MRTFLVVLAVVVLVPAWSWAEEIRGQVKSIDANANRVTVLVDGQERTMQCVPNCPVAMQQLVTTRRVLRRLTSVQEVITSLNQLTVGAQVTLTTETKNEADTVTRIRLQDTQTAPYASTVRRRQVIR